MHRPTTVTTAAFVLLSTACVVSINPGSPSIDDEIDPLTDMLGAPSTDQPMHVEVWGWFEVAVVSVPLWYIPLTMG